MGTTLRFEGDLTGPAAARAIQAIDGVPGTHGPLEILLADADCDDGAACAQLAAAIRRATGRVGDVVLVEPPQVLAHTLYRVGALSSGALQVVDPREELGTAG